MIKSISSVKVANQRVLVRAGFDVPLKKNLTTEVWEAADDTRIKDGLPTLKYLIDGRAKIVILSKLGRPEGWDKNFSSWPAAEKLGELLNMKVLRINKTLPDYSIPHVYFLPVDITKEDYSDLSQKIAPGSILYLENLFFYPGEAGKDEKFAKILKKFGDLYVEEAFASAHHAAASNVLLPKLLPSFGGITFLKEMTALDKVLKNPQKPMVLMLGGAKIDDKVETLKNLAPHADKILIGGAIAVTFYKAQGYEVGKSRFSNTDMAKDILRNFKDKIVLPVDAVVAKGFEFHGRFTKIEGVLPEEMILDIGPESIRKFSAIIKSAKTLIWNGPFGFIENPRFAFGSRSLAYAFSAVSKGPAYGVVGGGETIEVIDQAKVSEHIDHISMGGGAMLEYLAGKKLPAINVLEGK